MQYQCWVWYLIFEGKNFRVCSSVSHHYLISRVPSFSLSVTIAPTLSRLFSFQFSLVACVMSHSCSWQWLTPATLPHCPRVVNLFLGWNVEISVTYLKGPSDSIQQGAMCGQWCTGIGPSVQTHYCFWSVWHSHSRIPPKHMCTHEASHVQCRHTKPAHTYSMCKYTHRHSYWLISYCKSTTYILGMLKIVPKDLRSF